MKELTFLLFAALALASCQTPRQIAERKLHKALKIDPTILTVLDFDTTVKGSKDTIFVTKVPAIDRTSVDYTIDSLRQLLLTSKDTTIYLYRDSSTSIQVKKQPNGKVAVQFHVEPFTITDTLKVPYEVRVKVAAKTVTLEVAKPCYRYFWFWALLLALLLALFLLVKCRGKDGFTFVNVPNKKGDISHG